MLHPHHPGKLVWDLMIFLATSYFAIEVPLRLVLDIKSDSSLYLYERIFQIMFGLDILLNFFTGFQHEKRLILDRKLVAKRYLRSWFLVDFLSFFPFDLLGPQVYEMLGTTDLLRTLRLLRAVKVFELVRSLRLLFVKDDRDDAQNLEAISPVTFRLIFFIYWTFLFAHWTACGWIHLNPGFLAEESNPFRYVRALYWSVTTLTTIGYGDITPTTLVQTIYTMCIMIVGVGIYGYVIGNVSSILSNLDLSRVAFQEKLNHINSFLKYKKIPPHLANRVRSYYVNLWENKHGIDESDIWSDLPGAIKIDISLYLHEDLISKVPFFHRASEELKRELVMELKPMVFMKGDMVFREGDVANNMYFISKGSVEIFSEKKHETIAILQEGAFFGEMALVRETPRSATVRALEFCDLYTLSKESFQKIGKNHPSFVKHVLENMKIRSKERQAKLGKSPRKPF